MVCTCIGGVRCADGFGRVVGSVVGILSRAFSLTFIASRGSFTESLSNARAKASQVGKGSIPDSHSLNIPHICSAGSEYCERILLRTLGFTFN